MATKALKAHSADVIQLDLWKLKKNRRGMTRADRFWDQVDKSGGPKACWSYTGSRGKNGYGQFCDDSQGKRKSKPRRAHRVAMELHLDRPLAKNEWVLHSPECGTNRACCNPAHLRVRVNVRDAAHLENLADASAANRLKGRKLNSTKAQEIVQLKIDGVTSLAIATLYGVGEQSVWRIMTGQSYSKWTGDLLAKYAASKAPIVITANVQRSAEAVA
jgi:hypothetical protein